MSKSKRLAKCKLEGEMNIEDETLKRAPRTRATLSEVADLAGVSTTTVSLVLAGKADRLRIAKKTLDRVRAAADQLNYVPNLLVSSLRAGKTNIISYYSTFRHRELNDLYMDRISVAIEWACGQFGYDVLVHANFNRSTEDTHKFLNGGFADGLLLFAPLMSDPLLPYLRSSGVPTVLMNTRDSESILSSVQDDVETGMHLIASAFIERGHTNIAMIVEEGFDYRDAGVRAQLLKRNMAALGHPIADENIIEGHRENIDHVLTDLMARPNRPTGLFVWHDSLAYTTVEACERLCISVPGDLSIIGYDGMVWPSTTKHRVASVCVDLTQLALDSVEVLDHLIKNNSSPAIVKLLPITFDPGTTVGAL